MTPALLAFLDDVEHGRIPADEVRHRARLARGEAEKSAAVLDPPVDKVLLLRKALTWCGHATPESIETLGWEAHRYLWRVVACVASWSDRQVSGPSSAPIEGVDVGRMRELLEKATPGPWRYRPHEFDNWGFIRSDPRDDDPYDCAQIECRRNKVYWDKAALSEHRQNGTDPYEADARLIEFLLNNASALLTLASTLPARVAEAVMEEREACAQFCDAEFSRLQRAANKAADLEHGDRADRLDARSKAFHDAAHAIRSRPASAHPMASLGDRLAKAADEACSAYMAWEERGADINRLTSAMQELSSRAEAFVCGTTPPADDRVQRVVEAARVFRDAWKKPTNGLCNDERVAMFAALDALTDGAGP